MPLMSSGGQLWTQRQDGEREREREREENVK